MEGLERQAGGVVEGQEGSTHLAQSIREASAGNSGPPDVPGMWTHLVGGLGGVGSLLVIPQAMRAPGIDNYPVYPGWVMLGTNFQHATRQGAHRAHALPLLPAPMHGLGLIVQRTQG